MENLSYSVEKKDNDQSVMELPWLIGRAPSEMTDLDLVDFRTMLEELEYK